MAQAGSREPEIGRKSMEIDKSQIIELLKGLGKHDEASKAESELPDKVDTDKHGDLLGKFGIDPQDLLGKLGGGLGGLGGLLGR
jgi:hypothetical protein